MSDHLLAHIKAQKNLSDDVIAVLLPIMQEVYFPGRAPKHIVCGDMGSFARGTNNDVSPDLDIGFFGASNDIALGLKDWTSIGTFELTGNKAGITTLDEIDNFDPIVLQTIKRVQPVLDTYFKVLPGETQFNWVRSWIGYPGWVCNFSLPHPKFGTIEIDLNLGYKPSHFGIEHAQRFNNYFDRYLAEHGVDAAVKLIENIKYVKKRGKDNVRDTQGWVDRSKKLAGFIVEGLFMHCYPPHSYADLMMLIREHHWDPGRTPTDHLLGDQTDQIIDAGFSFDELLINIAITNEALPLGAWKNLYSIAQDFSHHQKQTLEG